MSSSPYSNKAETTCEYILNLNIKGIGPKTAEKIVNSGECYSYSGLKINGSDLIAIGFKGEEVGSTLNKILIDVIEGKTTDDRDILLKKAAKMYERKEARKRR